VKLTELFDLYRTKRLRFRSENTTRLYHHTIRSFGRSLGREPTIDDLTNDAIQSHMADVISWGNTPQTANKDRSQLLALWRYAATHRIVDRWPDVLAMPEPEIVPMGWMPEELAAIFAACDRQRGLVAGRQAGLWWSTLFRVLVDTGERIGAVRHLKKQHLQGRWILIPAEFRKGKKRDRLYPIQPATTKALAELTKGSASSALVFPWDKTDTYIYRSLTRILTSAGLPTDRRSKFHRIRRTVASAVAQAGGNPSEAMDHASPKTTKKYLDPRIVGTVPVDSILAAYLANPRPAPPPADAKRIG
jgi:integrase